MCAFLHLYITLSLATLCGWKPGMLDHYPNFCIHKCVVSMLIRISKNNVLMIMCWMLLLSWALTLSMLMVVVKHGVLKTSNQAVHSYHNVEFFIFDWSSLCEPILVEKLFWQCLSPLCCQARTPASSLLSSALFFSAHFPLPYCLQDAISSHKVWFHFASPNTCC